MLSEYAIVALIPSLIIRTYTDIWWFSSWRTCAHAYIRHYLNCMQSMYILTCTGMAWSSSNALTHIHKPQLH